MADFIFPISGGTTPLSAAITEFVITSSVETETNQAWNFDFSGLTSVDDGTMVEFSESFSLIGLDADNNPGIPKLKIRLSDCSIQPNQSYIRNSISCALRFTRVTITSNDPGSSTGVFNIEGATS